MSGELIKLQSYKVASVLQLLLSRFGHQRTEVRETIVKVLSKLAINYPQHATWWIYHFYNFEDTVISNKARSGTNQFKPAITRAQFAKDLLGACLKHDRKATEQIMSCETVFGDLRKLAEKEVSNKADTTMEMPKQLASIKEVQNLVMPTQENLTPQLPDSSFRPTPLESLCKTSLPICDWYEGNLKNGTQFFQDKEDDQE